MLKGTLILTLAGFLTKILGFLYRIFLSQTIGAQGMGIYQLIFPIHTLCFALTVGGIQTAISRFVAARVALKDEQGAVIFFSSPLPCPWPYLLPSPFCCTDMPPGLPYISCWRNSVQTCSVSPPCQFPWELFIPVPTATIWPGRRQESRPGRSLWSRQRA